MADLVLASACSLVRKTITRWGSPGTPSKNLAVPEMSSIPSRCILSRTTSVSLASTYQDNITVRDVLVFPNNITIL